MAGVTVLTRSASKYLALRRASGFAMRTSGSALRNFALFASRRGDRHIKTKTAVEWAAAASSPAQRDFRLRQVILFARHLKAEDVRHEIPALGVFGGGHFRRPVPFIFSPHQIAALTDAAARITGQGDFRPLMFSTLFGLLACTGMRVSEALRLRMEDVTREGLVIHETKFRKSRFVPLHFSARRALEFYLARRRRMLGETVFLAADGRRLVYSCVLRNFVRLLNDIGLDPTGTPRPRIHCLRHTFAVRSLEACAGDRARVGTHQVALATYLGHADLEGTYWYQRNTPILMATIADRAEQAHRGAR